MTKPKKAKVMPPPKPVVRLLSDMIEHSGHNCGDYQCFSDEDAAHANAFLASVSGFTWDDVDLLREAAIVNDDACGGSSEPTSVALRDLAARIAALLPPREQVLHRTA